MAFSRKRAKKRYILTLISDIRHYEKLADHENKKKCEQQLKQARETE